MSCTMHILFKDIKVNLIELIYASTVKTSAAVIICTSYGAWRDTNHALYCTYCHHNRILTVTQLLLKRHATLNNCHVL